MSAWWAVVVACAVAASGTPAAGADVAAVQMFGSLEAKIPIFALVPQPATAPSGGLPAPVSEDCGPQHFAADAAGDAFTFFESEGEAGCLSVVYDIDVPPGVDAFELSFVANRSVRTQGLPGEAPRLLQSVSLREGGKTTAQQTLFDPADGSRPERLFPIAFRLLDPSAPRVQVEWRFEDQGRPVATEPSWVAAFSATVRNPVTRFATIPLADPPVESEGLLKDQRYVTTHRVHAQVPPEFQAAVLAGQFSLRLEMPSSYLPVRVEGPDARGLDASLYETLHAGALQTVTIPAATLASIGPGPYVVHLEEQGALKEHGTFRVLSFIALGAPAAAIAAAWVGLRRTDTGFDA